MSLLALTRSWPNAFSVFAMILPTIYGAVIDQTAASRDNTTQIKSIHSSNAFDDLLDHVLNIEDFILVPSIPDAAYSYPEYLALSKNCL
ncbi:hypothetical protein QVD99_003316 [Batrachochytrium dendrobatidis]|nr:hypothetical protein QVD99_003316 [Batrachochytrium dendrobatidis]